MKKILLGLTTVVVVAAPIAAVMSCGIEDNTYNGPVVMTEYLASVKDAKEVKILGHKQELSQQFGWENIGGSQDYMATLATRLSTSKAPTLFNIENNASLEKIKDNVEHISTNTYAAGTQLQLLKDNLGKMKTNKLGGDALPAWLEHFGLIYNKDLMKQAGVKFVTTTITEGFDKSTGKLNQTKLTKNGLFDLFAYLNNHKVGKVETVMRFPGNPGAEWPFLSHTLGAAVGYASSTTGQGTMPDLSAGLEMLHKFVQYSGGANKVVSRDVTWQVGEFAVGKSFMIQQGSWMENNIYNTNPSINIGMLPLVFGTTPKTAITTSQFWVINSKVTPAKKEAAAKFLNHLYFTKEGQQLMGDAGVFNKAVLDAGVTVKNKVEDAAVMYKDTYESAHTKFPGHFNSGNSELNDAYRALVKAGPSGDAAFKRVAKAIWNK